MVTYLEIIRKSYLVELDQAFFTAESPLLASCTLVNRASSPTFDSLISVRSTPKSPHISQMSHGTRSRYLRMFYLERTNAQASNTEEEGGDVRLSLEGYESQKRREFDVQTPKRYLIGSHKALRLQMSTYVHL